MSKIKQICWWLNAKRMDVNFKMIGFYYILFGDSKTEIMYLFKTNKI